MSERNSSAQIVTELMLHEAASNSDDRRIEELQIYIRRGNIQINQPDEDWGNRTPLHWAAERGNPRCVKLLLDSGANPYARMTGGWTPAHCASEAGRSDILQTLIDYRTPIDIKDDYGDSPRNIAEIYGHTECAEILRKSETNPIQHYAFKGKKLWGTVQSFKEDIQENIRNSRPAIKN